MNLVWWRRRKDWISRVQGSEKMPMAQAAAGLAASTQSAEEGMKRIRAVQAEVTSYDDTKHSILPLFEPQQTIFRSQRKLLPTSSTQVSEHSSLAGSLHLRTTQHAPPLPLPASSTPAALSPPPLPQRLSTSPSHPPRLNAIRRNKLSRYNPHRRSWRLYWSVHAADSCRGYGVAILCEAAILAGLEERGGQIGLVER